MQGHTFEGDPCGRCGGTLRSKKTGRCMPCNVKWKVQSLENRAEREMMRGKPCPVCRFAMRDPCYDEHPDTGEFRGWICSNCNKGLGMLLEDADVLRRAARYIARHNKP